ncbi:response regulator transcription factor [Streptomyces sp. NPDC058695]|uniref:response regulator transcription factor n=1 Tax=Streptomyces sp. NPDC058695 TaxID=3346604 RepID=UPI003660D73C
MRWAAGSTWTRCRAGVRRSRRRLPSPRPAPRAAAAHALADVGRRELEVLSHLARGHRNRVIAQDLCISESTVKFHVANILSKLEVGSRGEAAAKFHAAA